jgi:predicted DNA-binding protein
MTISLRLDAALTRVLNSVAKARGVSKSELIRECLGKYLADEGQELTAWELGKNLFGRFNSGKGDLSTRAKEIARERLRASRTARNRRR